MSDYKSHDHKSEFGALGGSRTHDPRLRKPILYPAELRARCLIAVKKAPTPQNGLMVILPYLARMMFLQVS